MSGYVLAVDGGSQSTKVCVVDVAGRVRAAARQALRPYHFGADGLAVHPDDDLWDSLAATCRDALGAFRAAGGDLGQLAAVGLCGIRSCRALLDAEGRLTEPVLSWMDARIGEPVAELDPRVATLCSAGGYLAVRLTGRRRDSAASYDGLWPLDLRTRDWSDQQGPYAASGMRRDLLPDLVDPGGLLGLVTDDAARVTGLPAGLPVHATGNDKAVEGLGCGLDGSPDGPTVLSLGTYVAAMTAAPLPHPDAPADGRRWVNAAAVPGTYLHESGGVRRGMWTATWWRQLLAQAVGQAAGQAAGPTLGLDRTGTDEESLRDWLERGAASVPAGSDGLVTLPDWLSPAGEPWRRGAMLGFGAEHGPHHVHRSILEGLALTMRGNVEALEASLGRDPGDVLVLSGGGSRSALMGHIVADALGRPVRPPAEPDAAGTGAAICAAVGAGLHPDFATATAEMARPGEVVDPEPEARRRYDDLARTYADLPRLTEPVFRRLAQVRETPASAGPSGSTAGSSSP